MTKFASLCSGIGGLDIVCKKFGWEPAWHAEVEPNATLVHAERFGNKPNYGDISQISWADIQKPDVLTAGYPCQPFSYAGSRKGEDDHRHLWPHIKQTIHILRPETILLENVPGHITKGLPTVLQDLEDVGYTTKWMQQEAQILAGVIAENESGYWLNKRQGYTSRQCPRRTSSPRKQNYYQPRWWMLGYPAGWVTDPRLEIKRMNQYRLLGNAVQPQTAQEAYTRLFQQG